MSEDKNGKINLDAIDGMFNSAGCESIADAFKTVWKPKPHNIDSINNLRLVGMDEEACKYEALVYQMDLHAFKQNLLVKIKPDSPFEELLISLIDSPSFDEVYPIWLRMFREAEDFVG